jgi:hypothetical protein
MRPEEVFTIFCTSFFELVGQESRRESMDRPSVWAQSGCKTLQQENHAYASYDHHDEDVGHNQSI